MSCKRTEEEMVLQFGQSWESRKTLRLTRCDSELIFDELMGDDKDWKLLKRSVGYWIGVLIDDDKPGDPVYYIAGCEHKRSPLFIQRVGK